MFIELYKMLNSQGWYDTAPEIEILKGQFEKVSDWKDVVKKSQRNKKFLRKWQM